MLKKCAICGKGEQIGKVVARKGLAKAKGGTGSKICRANKHEFLPNLQKMRILMDNRPCRVYVCTKCIKKGELQRA